MFRAYFRKDALALLQERERVGRGAGPEGKGGAAGNSGTAGSAWEGGWAWAGGSSEGWDPPKRAPGEGSATQGSLYSFTIKGLASTCFRLLHPRLRGGS